MLDLSWTKIRVELKLSDLFNICYGYKGLLFNTEFEKS